MEQAIPGEKGMAWGPAELPLQPEEPRDGDQTSGERLRGSRLQAAGQNGRKVIIGMCVDARYQEQQEIHLHFRQNK